MKIRLRNKYLSRQRFNRYLHATGNDNTRAKKLYAANIRLAQAFHPILSQFEVVFRNSLNDVLATHFADADWIINQKAGFMSDPSLARSRFFLRTSVRKTEQTLARRGLPVTAGKIVSDQMFGFWLALYVPHHFMLIAGTPLLAFPLKPATENRASIHRKLEDVKNFRNRMNHCEPLCFRGNTIDCTYAIHIRTTLYDLLDWIDPDLRSYFQTIDTTTQKIASIMRI